MTTTTTTGIRMRTLSGLVAIAPTEAHAEAFEKLGYTRIEEPVGSPPVEGHRIAKLKDGTEIFDHAEITTIVHHMITVRDGARGWRFECTCGECGDGMMRRTWADARGLGHVRNQVALGGTASPTMAARLGA